MILKAPQGEQFRQFNRGDKFGDLWSSRNIDLENNWGKLEQSSPVLINTTLTTGYVGCATAFVQFRGQVGTTADRIWALTQETATSMAVWQASNPVIPFTDNAGYTLYPQGDMVVFDDQIYVASGEDILRRSTTTWNTAFGALAETEHLLAVYKNRMYITELTKVYSMNTSRVVSKTGANTLDVAFTSDLNILISSIASVSNGLWVGTIHNQGGNAEMIFWDGVTENAPDNRFKIDASGVLAIVIYQDNPIIVANNGFIYRFNGTFFEEIDRFPFGQRFKLEPIAQNPNLRFIMPNGVAIVRDEILFNINSVSGEDNRIENESTRIPSGIWAWSEKTGLYHKHSLSTQTDSATVKDYGQIELLSAGAIMSLVNSPTIEDYNEQSDFITSYSYKETNSTNKHVIAYNNKRNQTLDRSFTQASVFITPELSAQEAKENWQKFFATVSPLNSGEKVIVKYRTQKYKPQEMNITWVNTTSFTTTDSSMATIKTNFEAGIDYEFEGLQGDGAGQLAHITNITVNSGTYTVTLDETITGATTRTARVRLDRWTKVGTYTNALDEEIPFFKTDKISAKIQYKVYLFGKNIQVDNYLSKSSKHTPFE
jgi:hypothetical protein